MTTVEILTSARGLIDTPEKWTQKPAGRCGSKQRCAGFAVEDVCGGFCADSIVALQYIVGECGCDTVDFNDDPKTTHIDILNVFDRAIATASYEEALTWASRWRPGRWKKSFR